jgi:ABC-type proline/glycine betaine transport system ATPase subunit
MIKFEAEIERFASNGEKTGWTYIFIPHTIAEQIKPGERRSIRVKGTLDQTDVSAALMPMGGGDFIMALNKEVRKKLKKDLGTKVSVSLAYDPDFKIEMPEDLEICLADERILFENFLSMPKSHQNHFINWLNSAKTEQTRTKRLVMIVNAMANEWDFGMMVRSAKEERQ